MSSTRKKVLKILIILNFSLVLFLVLFIFIFEPLKIIKEGPTDSCIFQKIFGFYCPGCGGTRSVGYLVNFDFYNSFVVYPPIYVGIVLIFSTEIILLKAYVFNDFFIIRRHKWTEYILIPVSIILNFLIKNILLYFNVDIIGDIL